MIRALAPYLVVSLTTNAAAGGSDGAGLMGARAPLYGLLMLASIIGLVAYVRWDERQRV